MYFYKNLRFETFHYGYKFYFRMNKCNFFSNFYVGGHGCLIESLYNLKIANYHTSLSINTKCTYINETHYGKCTYITLNFRQSYTKCTQPHMFKG